jgi:predicted phosphodiesterase
MRVAVISDVHGNLAALEAVLEVIDLERPDELWCLGDLTGYGARPGECLALVRERAAVCLAGNHDLVVAGAIDISHFSSDAAVAARWAREQLDEAALRDLAALEPSGARHGVSLFHGSIRDPVWEYVLSAGVAEACLREQTTELALIGHSHVALTLALVDGEVAGGQARSGMETPLEGHPTLLNPGSVGQPRDRDPRAAWLLLDLEQRQARFRRTPYDVERTQREILEAGLPARLAERREIGA